MMKNFTGTTKNYKGRANLIEAHLNQFFGNDGLFKIHKESIKSYQKQIIKNL